MKRVGSFVGDWWRLVVPYFKSEEWPIAIGLLIVIFAPNRQQIMEWRWQNDWVYAGVFAALAGISVMAMSNPPPFIYFQF